MAIGVVGQEGRRHRRHIGTVGNVRHLCQDARVRVAVADEDDSSAMLSEAASRRMALS
jgi:hypothetical protein